MTYPNEASELLLLLAIEEYVSKCSAAAIMAWFDYTEALLEASRVILLIFLEKRMYLEYIADVYVTHANRLPESDIISILQRAVDKETQAYIGTIPNLL